MCVLADSRRARRCRATARRNTKHSAHVARADTTVTGALFVRRPVEEVGTPAHGRHGAGFEAAVFARTPVRQANTLAVDTIVGSMGSSDDDDGWGGGGNGGGGGGSSSSSGSCCGRTSVEGNQPAVASAVSSGDALERVRL